MEEEENGSLTSCCPTDDGICTSGSEGRPGDGVDDVDGSLFIFIFILKHISTAGVRGSALSLTSADDAGSE